MSATDDLRNLYPDAVLEHARRPRNRRATTACTHQGRAENPLCGDEVAVGLELEDGLIRAVAFDGQSCAIATASASLMTEVLIGRTPAEARALFTRVRDVAGGRRCESPDKGETDPRLGALSCVSGYPERVECATLAWRGMLQALDERKESR